MGNLPPEPEPKSGPSLLSFILQQITRGLSICFGFTSLYMLSIIMFKLFGQGTSDNDFLPVTLYMSSLYVPGSTDPLQS